MRRLRVLHVVGGLGLGGGQKLTALVAAGLDRGRFDVHVLNLGSPGTYGGYLRSRGVPVTDLGLPMRLGWSSFGALGGFGRLLNLLFRRPRWDIVHTHMFRTSLLCAVLARLAGSRLFGTVHRIYFWWQPWVEFLLAPLHEAIVVDSIAVGRILQAKTHIASERYAVIYNGIDVGEFATPPSRAEARAGLGLPERSVVVTEIAHFSPHKGQNHLVSALARMADPAAHVLFVGDGPTKPSVESLARSLGLASRVTFAGARSDLIRLLAATDILALPSTFEGFGIVQAEAMYMEIPVVATNAGGSTEVVVDGVTGYLVPFGDAGALGDRLARLAGSEALRRQFGAAGRSRVLKLFTQETMAKRYACLYEHQLRKGLDVGG